MTVWSIRTELGAVTVSFITLKMEKTNTESIKDWYDAGCLDMHNVPFKYMNFFTAGIKPQVGKTNVSSGHVYVLHTCTTFLHSQLKSVNLWDKVMKATFSLGPHFQSAHLFRFRLCPSFWLSPLSHSDSLFSPDHPIQPWFNHSAIFFAWPTFQLSQRPYFSLRPYLFTQPTFNWPTFSLSTY